MRPPPLSLAFTQVHEWTPDGVRATQDALAAEEPLEIRIGDAPLSVTMRTPGHDLELAAGFLLTEGLIQSRRELLAIKEQPQTSSMKGNIVSAEIHDHELSPLNLQRNFFAASSCGICGKASIDAIRRRELSHPNPDFRVSPQILRDLPVKVREKQAVFERTGGLHAAALFSSNGELLVMREDIGRHNAVDKVIGWALLQDRVPLHDCLLWASGRGGFEIVQKALAAGVPALACVSAPSSLGVKLAREFGLTLIGFLRDQRFVVYSGDFRCFH